MSGRGFVSRFSPNRTNPALLEAIFVQRHALAEDWLGRLRDSILGDVKHHLLAVGPRGCGKSHLVVLLVTRLKSDPEIREKARIAWLPEDETTPSFWKFLLRIFRALNAEYGDEFAAPPRDQLNHATDDRRAAILSKHLLDKLGDRTLLVVVENLDEVMRGLKLEGQKRWRAFLQENRVAATLASTQQMTKDVSDRDRPFFNFFEVENLQPLTSDEALLLLQKLAEHSQNTRLIEFLQTKTGRARVRAIRHIAGGSHRVFIILSEFLTRESLDDLVTAFEELLDELTPYYQERLRWLADQQREIVEFLCRQVETVPVKDIAEELFHTNQTAATQLKGLKEKGYVISATAGRESRYELAEPLMRLCVEVKDPQREPIRLIVEFLRIWYDRDEVENRLRCLPDDADLGRRYYQAVLKAHDPDIPDPVQQALSRDLEAARATGDTEEVVRVLVDLGATSDSPPKLFSAAVELGDCGLHVEALAVYDRLVADPEYAAASWHNKGYTLIKIDQPTEALAACERAVELDPDSWSSWGNMGYVLNILHRPEEAIAAYDRSIKILPSSSDSWSARGETKLELGRFTEAVIDLRHAMKLDGQNTWALESLGTAFFLQDNWEESEQVVAQRFAISSLSAKSQQLADFIATLFIASSNPETWKHRVNRLVEIASKASQDLESKKSNEDKNAPSDESTKVSAEPSPLALIGDALVRSLTNPAYARSSAASLEQWAGVWREVAKQYTDLSLATRLFAVGLRYVASKDERVLLDLVQEERSIVRELFGLQEREA